MTRLLVYRILDKFDMKILRGKVLRHMRVYCNENEITQFCMWALVKKSPFERSLGIAKVLDYKASKGKHKLVFRYRIGSMHYCFDFKKKSHG